MALTPTVQVNVSGARGASAMDTMRVTGQFGAALSDTDEQVMAKLAAALAAETIGAAGAVPYATTGAGIAATTNGQFFYVVGASTYSLYKNVAGTAVEQKQIVTSDTIVRASDKTTILVGGADKQYVFDDDGLILGGPAAGARLTAYSGVSDALHVLNLYGYAGQGVSSAYSLIHGHWYADGDLAVFDHVGSGFNHILRAGRNPTARADKPSTYVGTGGFLRFLATTTTGTGGSLGDGNNLLMDFTRKGSIIHYGANETDWDASFSNAPEAFKPQNAAARGLYMGYQPPGVAPGGLARAIIGVIEDGVAFENLDLAASAVRPIGDNAVYFGAASLRWKEIYAAVGTINTSDEREKKWRGKPNAAEMRAARRIIDELGFYQWLDAIHGREGSEHLGNLDAAKGKGKNARLHFGARAQQVWAIMADEKLVDPIDKHGRPGKTPYAFLCFDEWDEQTEEVTEEREVKRLVHFERPGKIIDPATKRPVLLKVSEQAPVIERVPTGEIRVLRKAGDRFGLRLDQLALFLIAGQAARQDELEARLAKLEAA